MSELRIPTMLLCRN